MASATRTSGGLMLSPRCAAPRPVAAVHRNPEHLSADVHPRRRFRNQLGARARRALFGRRGIRQPRGRLSFRRARACCSIRRTACSRASTPAIISSASRRASTARSLKPRASPISIRRRSSGIGVDSTGSSPIPVDAENRPLAMDDKWKGDLNAQCWLWKDHTSWREAARITELCAKLRPQYIAKMRRGLLLRMVLGQALALPERRSRDIRAPPSPGSSSPTGCRPCSPAWPTRDWSSGESAPPATRRSTPTIGAACRTRSS